MGSPLPTLALPSLLQQLRSQHSHSQPKAPKFRNLSQLLVVLEQPAPRSQNQLQQRPPSPLDSQLLTTHPPPPFPLLQPLAPAVLLPQQPAVDSALATLP